MEPVSSAIARKINREAVVLLGWGRAVLLQLAHPLVAAAVSDYSRFRRGPRGYVSTDVLLPDGYVAEVVATGFSAPVMTTFGPDGAAYVVESGHKVDDPPRIRRVDTAGGTVTISPTRP